MKLSSHIVALKALFKLFMGLGFFPIHLFMSKAIGHDMGGLLMGL